MFVDWSKDSEILKRIERIDITLKNNQRNISDKDFYDYGETYFFINNCLKRQDDKLVLQHTSWYGVDTVKQFLKNIEDYYKINENI